MGYEYKIIAREGEWPFRPFWFQSEFLSEVQKHTREKPARAMAVWPRRHGKDLTALHGLLERAHDRVGMYWHGLPVYEQARKSCWTAFRTDTGQRLMDNVFPREVVRRPSEWAPNAEMVVELKNGSIINFVGSDTIDALVGAGLAGLNASEFALWRPHAYDLLRPILREAGAWATFITTPRGHNHAFKMYERMKRRGQFVSHLTIYTAGRYSKVEADAILAEERADGMLEELVKQEYLTDFSAANVGSYWGDLVGELEKVGAVSADFDHERDGVYVVFDLGINDSTAIWAFRVTSDGADFVNHYEASGKPISHFFDRLDAWSQELGYKYAGVLLPHDAKARTLLTGTSLWDAFYGRYGSLLHLVPPLSVLDGIQAGRRLLQQKVRFHKRCDRFDGVEALRMYHRRYDEDRRVFLLHPEHDWSSHSADAFRYGAVMMDVLRGRVAREAERRAPRVLVPPKLTLDQLWKNREQRGPFGRRRA